MQNIGGMKASVKTGKLNKRYGYPDLGTKSASIPLGVAAKRNSLPGYRAFNSLAMAIAGVNVPCRAAAR